MKVLLIYELVPEKINLYTLDVDQETIDKLRKCVNCYGNSVGLDEEVDKLVNDWLPGFLGDKEVREKTFIMVEPCEVIVTGFYL